jgi:hypothetical protein
MKYSISSDGTEVEFEEQNRITDDTAYIGVSIADMRTILAEMEAQYNREDSYIESEDSFYLNGVQYLAVPEPSPSDGDSYNSCNGCAFVDTLCWDIARPPCSIQERAYKTGIIWKAQ